MMNDIPDYRDLTPLYQSSRTAVYRAVREVDGQAVVLKLLDRTRSGPGEIVRLQQEYARVRGLTAPNVVTAYEGEPNSHLPMLVFEDFGGESLKALAAVRAFTISECIDLGIEIADGLAAIHAAGVVHKDINPANIVYNARTGDLKIIDFGSSTSYTREQPTFDSAEVLEGTLPYISPEQTGRMNRSVDYRTDFYSFGATLYELLVGHPPFEETDPLSLVHAHIAKEPTQPSSLNPSIPAPLSAIVMKLLAKTARERYQSAAGIKQDLEECARQLARTDTIVDFPLGRNDRIDSPRPSQHLYGRDADLAALVSAFERAAVGSREVVMVTGYSGVGKTSLVRELYKPITAGHGYFISGKFDQLQRNVPYRAIVNALQGLVRQLLGESDAKLAVWKEKLVAALGDNGQIVVDFIPEIEHIIGPQPALAPLRPVQEQNRFNTVFSNFIRVFCQPEHPLALYLDDLQWVDPPSLKLIAHLLQDGSLRNLLFVGAYRDNEVAALHPVAVALEALKQGGVHVQILTLRALEREHVRQLVADSLCMAPNEVAQLAELIAKKTAGNPYFTEEFLKSLCDDKLLTFDRAQGRWHWDIGRIELEASSDNAADLMIAKLKRLDVETQKVLQLSACIGSRFDVQTAAIICQQPIADTTVALRQAITEGLVLPLTSSSPARSGMRFVHDRVQAAAYSLIPEAQRRAARLEVGRLLLRDLPEHEREERLFEIVNHLNAGIAEISAQDEKNRLIQLNLDAGHKASRSNAYDAALDYFQAALDLVGSVGWDRQYDLMLALHTEAAQAAFLGRRIEETDRLVEAVLRNAKTLLDKIDAYCVRIESLLARSRLQDASDLGFEISSLLGIRYPKSPSRLRLMYEYYRLRMLLFRKSTEALVNAPLMQDPYRLAEMRLLQPFLTAVYFSGPRVASMLVFRAVRISAQYGNTPYSAFAYASYGATLCVATGNMTEARRFAEISLAVVERLNAVGMKASVTNLVHAHVNPWSTPLHESLAPLQKGFHDGVETGDLEYAGLCGISHTHAVFLAGMPLTEVEATANRYGQAVAKGVAYNSISVHRQQALNLLGSGSDPCQLKGEAFDEDAMLEGFRKEKQSVSLLSYYAAKLTLSVLFERYDDALRVIPDAKRFLMSAATTVAVPAQFFLYALVSLIHCPGRNDSGHKQALERVDRLLKKMREWADAAPMNNGHRVCLIEAERFRVLGQSGQAAERYDRAIELAKKDKYTMVEALANELAGKFYLGLNRTTLAQGYLREAHGVYARWGAVAKVRQMEAKYSFLTQDQVRVVRLGDTATTVVTESMSIDLKGLMRALKEISSDQIHSQLLEKTIVVSMEIAGAQNALLFLRGYDDELYLEAEGSAAAPPRILQSTPLAVCKNVSQTVVNYVTRTKQSVVIRDAQVPQTAIPGLHEQGYVKEGNVRSILCIPLLSGELSVPELSGLLYLENNAVSHAFVERVREPLEIICLAASGRLELSRRAVTDRLTELYNHDYLQGILKKEASLAARTGRDLSLIMIDIDHFKKFNDDYGHQAGDAVLAAVAQTIKGSARQSDVVARYGGEEMTVVLPDTNMELAYEVAERIRSNIEATRVPFEQKVLSVTASLGIASYGAATADPTALVKAADQALYGSKHAGRNCITAARALCPK